MVSHTQKYIGVFDSGFGGIDVLRGLVKELPTYDFLYLGDTARTPYGTRSSEIVYEFTKQAVDYMFSQGCELILLACNTASSEALRKIQREHIPVHHPGKRVLGVLIPAAEEAIAQTENKKIGVIATEGTVASGAFERELKKIDSSAHVFQQACPLLVPLVESGEYKSQAAKMILEDYLTPLKEAGVDTLILGCTHYGMFEGRIKEYIGDTVTIVSEANTTPAKLKEYLKRHQEIDERLSKSGMVQFYTTDLSERFESLGSMFFGKKIKAQKISLN